jgi:hypothetical protein
MSSDGQSLGYVSKVDPWIAVLLALAPVVNLGIGLALWETERTAAWISLGSAVFVGAVTAVLAFPCRYRLDAGGLFIQAGVMTETVPYSRIHGVALVTSWQAAPALSLSRVKIILDDGFRLVSPADREQFVRDLSARLQAEGLPVLELVKARG